MLFYITNAVKVPVLDFALQQGRQSGVKTGDLVGHALKTRGVAGPKISREGGK